MGCRRCGCFSRIVHDHNLNLQMEPLLGKNMEELGDVCSRYGLRSFVAGQMADWLYRKRVRTVDEMTNLSKAARAAVAGDYEVGRTGYSDMISSADGTRKYLFPFGPGVEAVMIPEKDRHTVCVSSQMGCRMGCRFCMTGRQGWHGNLTVAGILSQFMEIDEAGELTNAVFMGMGEPLDNWDNVRKAIDVLTSDWGFGWSPKRITLSTIGVTSDPRTGESPLRRFMDECSCHLAVSLHNPFPEERAELMPMEKPFPIERTLSLIREYDFTGQRRVSFEYIMFAGVNDDKRHAYALAGMLRGLECRVNLIRFHRIPDSPLAPSPMPVIERFKEILGNAGVLTTLRASRGEDILAACGMLSGKGRAAGG